MNIASHYDDTISSQSDDISDNISENSSDSDTSLTYIISTNISNNSLISSDIEIFDASTDVSSRSSSIRSNFTRNGGLSIYYTNADSLLNKRDELQTEISAKDPDFIVITEVYPKSVKPTDINRVELELKGYDIIIWEATDNSRRMCIYHKSELAVNECKDFKDSRFQESCWCVVNLDSNERLLLGAIYHSPSSSAINTNKLNMLLHSAVEKYDYLVLIGDFNFPTIDWDNWSTPHSVNHPEFKFIECLRDSFLSQVIDSRTRYRDGQNSNILDLVILDKPEIFDGVEYYSNLGASDHVSLQINLNCSPETNRFDLVKRNYHKGDYDQIRADLSTVEWNQIKTMSVNEGYDLIVNSIKTTVEKYIHMKTTETNDSKNLRKKKWMNKDCFKSIKKK